MPNGKVLAYRKSVPAREPRKSREAWIVAAVEALGEGGVEAIRVEPLARRLGVTKGSFYWHFRDRAELLTAVLAAWSNRGTDAVIEQVEAEGGDARARMRRLWAITSVSGLEPEFALRDWAKRDAEVDAVVQDVDRRRMGYLRQLFGELGLPRAQVEARCLLAYSLLIGNAFIDPRHSKVRRSRTMEEALKLLLDE